MIILILVFVIRIVLAFIFGVYLAIVVHRSICMLKEVYPSIDLYSWVLIFWVLALTVDLPAYSGGGRTPIPI